LKQIICNRSSSSNDETNEEGTNTEKSGAESFFDELHLGSSNPENILTDPILIEKVLKLTQHQRQPIETDPFLFYERYRESDPLIYELAKVVFSAPCDQVSVERSFNGLKLLISPARSNLSKDMMENILIINLNRDLLPFVNFEEM
jgi:hypothetical protein